MRISKKENREAAMAALEKMREAFNRLADNLPYEPLAFIPPEERSSWSRQELILNDIDNLIDECHDWLQDGI